MIKLETRDWVALASAAAGLAAFVLLRAPAADNKKPKDAPWARSKKKGENGTDARISAARGETSPAPRGRQGRRLTSER